MSYARFQALAAATTSPWTRDLRHVRAAIPRAWARKPHEFSVKIKSVKPKDRIKWWNIVPGDQVRLRGDPEGAIREVRRVNKLTNRVYLKSINTSEGNEKPFPDRQVPYSRCQLFVGNHSFPPLPGQSEPRAVPVFATRVTTSNPSWSPLAHRYHWERYAANTTPRLPGSEKTGSSRELHLPWPERQQPPKTEPTAYDTSTHAVTEITYAPPPLPRQADALVPDLPSEHQYIKSLRKLSGVAYQSWQPFEVHLHKELANSHSRAKKQQRWQAYQLYKRSLLQQYVKKEYDRLSGRTRRQAREEATWKWKQKLLEEKKAETKRRWKNRGQEQALAAKQVRKARKEERIHNKLQNLVLQSAPNQLVPGPSVSV